MEVIEVNQYKHILVEETWRHDSFVVVINFIEDRYIDKRQIQEISDEMAEAFRQSFGKRRVRLVVSFAGVKFLSSDYLDKLLLLERLAVKQDVRLWLCEMAPEIEEIFNICRLNLRFDITGTREEALAAAGYL